MPAGYFRPKSGPMRYSKRSLGGSSGPAGRRFRASRGLLFAYSSDEIGLAKILRWRGQFTSLQGHVREVNQRLALELVDLMVSNLDRTIVRPSVSTGRLADALSDPRNRHVDQTGFGVGNPEFLDSSQAKYWRAIELGTRKFVGMQIRGVWGGTLTGGEGHGRTGPYPLAGAPFSGFGERFGDRLRPMSRAAAYKLLRQAGVARADIHTRGVIKKPITAHLYMRRAWQEFDVKDRAQDIVNQVLAQAGLPARARPATGKRRRP